MTDSGDWLEPTMLGRPYFRKPPLMLWLTAGSIALLGPTSAAAVLPSIVMGILLVLLLHLVATRALGARAGLLAPALLLAHPGFDHFTTACRMDSALHLACFAAVAALRFVRPRGPAFALFWTALAVGFLAKGPAALMVLPVLVLVAVVHRDAGPLGRRAFWLSALLFLALLLPWYARMTATHGPAFWEVHLGRQVVDRLAPAEFRPLVRGIGAGGFLGMLGALAVLGAALALRGVGRSDRSPDDDRERGWWLTLSGAWVLVLLAFHLVNRSGYPRYLYHALAPAALLAAHGVDLLLHRRVRPGHLAVAAGIGAMVLLVAVRTGITPRSTPDLEGMRRVVREHVAGPELPYLADPPEPTANFVAYYLDRKPRRVLERDATVLVESADAPWHAMVEVRSLPSVRAVGGEVLVTVGRFSMVRFSGRR